MQSIQAASRFPDDCLPPEAEYDSRDALFSAINAWAAPRGYAFVTGRSRKEKTGRVTVTYACDRSRRPPSQSINRIRKTSTRSTCCQFSVLAKQSLDTMTWSLRHRPDSQFAVHNHDPSLHQSAHPTHRALSNTDRSSIIDLSTSGTAPRDIQTYLRQNSNTIATRQDIYNRISESKRQLRNGQSTMHAFAKEMEKEGFWYKIQVDTSSRATAILFAHPKSLEYLKAYPDLLLLDCTYNTNTYKMPLLDCIGVDACERSFCIAFAFLSGETEGEYFWVLSQLRSIYEQYDIAFPSVILTDRCLACMAAIARCFPSAASLLCLWHANKAVVAYCRQGFVTKDSEDFEGDKRKWKDFFDCWHSIIKSKDERTFNQRIENLEQRYALTLPKRS